MHVMQQIKNDFRTGNLSLNKNYDEKLMLSDIKILK